MKTLILALALLAGPAASPQETETVVSGTVRLGGKLPKPPRPAPAGNPDCDALHAQGVPKEELVFDAEGRVRWVFVHVRKGLEGRTFPVPPEAVILDQKACVYVPHVLGIMAGQELRIRSSDNFLHNVRGVGVLNPGFNFAMPGKGEVPKTFKTPEVMFRVQCQIHPWMGAWVGVLSHPYYSVTDASGRFEIRGLPPGKYEIEAWHEKYRPVVQVVEVKAAHALDFTLTEKRE